MTRVKRTLGCSEIVAYTQNVVNLFLDKTLEIGECVEKLKDEHWASPLVWPLSRGSSLRKFLNQSTSAWTIANMPAPAPPQSLNMLCRTACDIDSPFVKNSVCCKITCQVDSAHASQGGSKLSLGQREQ